MFQRKKPHELEEKAETSQFYLYLIKFSYNNTIKKNFFLILKNTRKHVILTKNFPKVDWCQLEVIKSEKKINRNYDMYIVLNLNFIRI